MAATAMSAGASLGLGAAEQAIGNVSSGLFGQLFGGLSARRMWKYQKKQMELQQKYALEQMEKQFEYGKQKFDYENEYNNPVNVIARYQSAGINPAALFGSGGIGMSATMGSGQDVSSGGTPHPGANIGASELGAPAPSSLTALSSIRQAEAQANFSNAAAANQEAQSSYYDELAKNQPNVRNLLSAQTSEATANTFLTEIESSIRQIDFENHRDMVDAQLSEIFQRIDTLASSQKVNEQTVSLLREQVLTESVYRASLRSGIELNDAQRAFLNVMHDQAYSAHMAALRNRQLVVKDPDTGQIQYYNLSEYEASSLAASFAAMHETYTAWQDKVSAAWANSNQVKSAITDYLSTANSIAGTYVDSKTAGAYSRLAKTAASREVRLSDEQEFQHNVTRARWRDRNNRPKPW